MKLEYLIPSLIVLGLLSALALAQQETELKTWATIEKYISVTPSYVEVDFGTVNRSTTNNVPVNLDQTLGQFNFTISTNYDYRASAKVAGIPAGLTQKISISPNLADAINVTLAKTLSDVYQYFPSVSVPEGGTYIDYHGHWLDVAEPKAGTHMWFLYILYENL